MALSENISLLRPSATIAVSSLAKRLRGQGRDVIDLSAGEPDFDTPPFVVDAAVEGVRAGRTRYTPAAGLPELRQAVAERLGAGAVQEVLPEGVVVTCGAKQAIFNALFCLAGPGDRVLIAAPYWTSYPEMVTLARAEPVPVRGPEERDYRVGPEDLDRAAAGGARALLLNSPSNPTGTVYPADELEAVARWCRERDVVLISDEIYRRIYYGDDRDRAPGVLELPADALGRFVVVDGVSKSMAMTGWRIGFAATDPELAAKMGALQSHTTSNAATPSQVAALAALEGGERTEEAVREMKGAFRRRRDLVTRLMDERLPALEYLSPMGAFYLFFRVDPLFGPDRDDASDVCTWMLEKAGVALVPGGAFGDDRFVRMSFASAESLLEDGIGRIAELAGG